MEDALRLRAREDGAKTAVVMADGSADQSYAALDAQADEIAAAFQALGLNAGETIALLLDNSCTVPALWWGARRAGLYYVPLGTRLTAAELGFIVQDCDARAMIVSASYEDIAEAVGSALNRKISIFGSERAGGRLPSLMAGLPPGQAKPRPVEAVGRELIYSSGTTGRPKGIRRPLGTIDDLDVLPALETRMREVFRISRDTVYLSVSPLYHATGRFLNRVVEAGGTAVILPAFDPAQALTAIERHRVTNTQWVPTMFVRLLALPEAQRCAYDLSSHRVALHAAAPCPIAVKRAMIDWWGPIVDEYYGGSENAGVTFITAPEWLHRPGSVGRSITGAVHILAEDGSGEALGAGEIGLICFEGGVPFTYMNVSPEEPSATGRSGYATYGDLGHLDDEGYLYISDRRSDLIITGGVNVYPKEIELVLEAHPGVAEAAVIGVADAEFGASVRAVIVVAESYPADLPLADLLARHCREHLSGIKCPRSFVFADELPRNENGKLLKRLLRTQMEGARVAS